MGIKEGNNREKDEEMSCEGSGRGKDWGRMVIGSLETSLSHTD